MNKQVGEFNITVSDPAPIWIRISKGDNTITFSHHELPDIEHAIKEARRSSENKMSRIGSIKEIF